MEAEIDIQMLRLSESKRSVDPWLHKITHSGKLWPSQTEF